MRAEGGGVSWERLGSDLMVWWNLEQLVNRVARKSRPIHHDFEVEHCEEFLPCRQPSLACCYDHLIFVCPFTCVCCPGAGVDGARWLKREARQVSKGKNTVSSMKSLGRAYRYQQLHHRLRQQHELATLGNQDSATSVRDRIEEATAAVPNREIHWFTILVLIPRCQSLSFSELDEVAVWLAGRRALPKND